MPFKYTIKQVLGSIRTSKRSRPAQTPRTRVHGMRIPASWPCAGRQENVDMVITVVPPTQRAPSSSASSSSNDSACGSPLWALPEQISSCSRVTDDESSYSSASSLSMPEQEICSGRGDYGFDVWVAGESDDELTLIPFLTYVSWNALVARVASKTQRSLEDIVFSNKKYVGLVSNEEEYKEWLECATCEAQNWNPDLYLL